MHLKKKIESFLTYNFCSFSRKNASEINDYYNEDYVTQHDLLRELAMFESCQGPKGQRQRWIIDASENTQDQQPIKAHLLSISIGLFMFSLITDKRVITHMHGYTQSHAPYILSAFSHRL